MKYLDRAGNLEGREVTGTPVGKDHLLGVHSLDKGSGLWRITHIPTGQGVVQVKSRPIALAAAKWILGKMGAAWWKNYTKDYVIKEDPRFDAMVRWFIAVRCADTLEDVSSEKLEVIWENEPKKEA